MQSGKIKSKNKAIQNESLYSIIVNNLRSGKITFLVSTFQHESTH